MAAFFGALGLNRLPQFWHPAFGAAKFARATTDGFFIFVEAGDEKFEESAVRRLLESLGATGVEPCFEASQRPRFSAGDRLDCAGGRSPWPSCRRCGLRGTRLVKSATPRLDIFSDMDFQPKYTAQAASAFFADGRAARLPVPGTVSRGGLEADAKFYRGKAGDQFVGDVPDDADPGDDRARPGAVQHLLRHLSRLDRRRRPQRRHDRPAGDQTRRSDVGDADLAARRGGARSSRWEQIFQTITNGIRTMPSYAAQIPPEDRWAIILYVRALQRSQNASLDDVPEDKRMQLR